MLEVQLINALPRAFGKKLQLRLNGFLERIKEYFCEDGKG